MGWLSARRAARDGPAQQAFQVSDEVRVSERTAGEFRRSDRGERGLILAALNQVGEALNPVERRAHGHQPVILAGKVGADAGPTPVFGPDGQPRAHRIWEYGDRLSCPRYRPAPVKSEGHDNLSPTERLDAEVAQVGDCKAGALARAVAWALS
jgi:hypothetical protein